MFTIYPPVSVWFRNLSFAYHHDFCDKLVLNAWMFQMMINCSYSALSCYPNVKGAIRNLSFNTPTATIFLLFNCFTENIWVLIWVQFHFLGIFVGQVDRIHKTSHITMLSFNFFSSDLQSFRDQLNRSSKTPQQIFELMKIQSKYLDISNCVLTMNCSTDKKSFSCLF